jgi:hypothetical protein
MCLDDLFEQRDAGGAKTGGQIGDRRQIDLSAKHDRAGQRQPVGKPGDEFRIIGALAVARLMVEMDDVQREIGPPLQ